MIHAYAQRNDLGHDAGRRGSMSQADLSLGHSPLHPPNHSKSVVSIKKTADWYFEVNKGACPFIKCLENIREYNNEAF